MLERVNKMKNEDTRAQLNTQFDNTTSINNIFNTAYDCKH